MTLPEATNSVQPFCLLFNKDASVDLWLAHDDVVHDVKLGWVCNDVTPHHIFIGKQVRHFLVWHTRHPKLPVFINKVHAIWNSRPASTPII